MNLAENLKKIRKDNNLSQEQLAEKLGVSRQSVSKWESGQAYPEMDKVLQICKMFNLNIDDLLNQDIKQINEVKQNKINISKYIDEVFDYITKTIDMFSSMKFKDKLKCFFEQICIIIVLLGVFSIIGLFGSNIVWSLLSFLPNKFYNLIYNILESIYLIICLVVGLSIFLHIFKIRYLDYYIILKDNNHHNLKEEDKAIEQTSKNKKLYIEKNSEKVIIRDPKHAGYRFISGLLKLSLFCIKIIVTLACIGFSFSLVGFVVAFILSFLLNVSGLLFIGCLITFISCIIINIIILNILYNFITNGKIRKSKNAVVFLISLIFIGTGISLITIGFSNINYSNDISKNSNYLKIEKELEMKDDLIIDIRYLDNVSYIESDLDFIKIDVWYSKFYNIDITKYDGTDNKYLIYWMEDEKKILNLLRTYVNDINNLEFVDYSKIKVDIYASKENINKLQQNLNNYDMLKYRNAQEETINNLQLEIDRLNDELIKKDERKFELEEKTTIN